MPVILWNVWAFVAPGLHKHERKYAMPFVLVGSILFLSGGAFAAVGVSRLACELRLYCISQASNVQNTTAFKSR